MPIKTKIVATLGPASWELPQVRALIEAGVDVFRLNFSHGTIERHAASLANVRTASQQLGRPVAVMADLCGPKIRVGTIAGGEAVLHEGDSFVIQREPVDGTSERISTTLPELIDEVRKGDRLSFDDGRIVAQVVRTRAPREIAAKVIVGGILRTSKGVNLPDTELSLPALTEKDRRDTDWIAQQDIDYVALSFVQRAKDIEHLRGILSTGGSTARIIAKIEKPQALRNIDAIVDAADGILVARGDLGVEMPLPEVPIAQKRLARLCEQAGKPCIIATQMLESMIDLPTPTRAEVSDVANAVLDGADAVMLSGETAVGRHAVAAVRVMNAILDRTEQYLADGQCHHPSIVRLEGTEAAILSAVHCMVHSDTIRAVAVFTATGNTARLLGKMRLEVPVLALTPSARARQQACLFYGVTAEQSATPRHTREVLSHAARRIRALRWAKRGEKIIVVSGRPLGTPGSTNSVVVHTV